jgi:hypothetical protein
VIRYSPLPSDVAVSVPDPLNTPDEPVAEKLKVSACAAAGIARALRRAMVGRKRMARSSKVNLGDNLNDMRGLHAKYR